MVGWAGVTISAMFRANLIKLWNYGLTHACSMFARGARLLASYRGKLQHIQSRDRFPPLETRISHPNRLQSRCFMHDPSWLPLHFLVMIPPWCRRRLRTKSSYLAALGRIALL